MLISCPECTTKFSIADAVLGDRGRKVRCFKCGHTWHQDPPSMQPSVAPAPAPSMPDPQPRPPTQPLMPPTPTVVEHAEPEPAPFPQAAPTPAPAPAPPPMAAPQPMPSVPLESDPMEGGFVPPAPPTNSGSIPLDSDPLANAKPSVDPLDIPKVDDVDAAAVAPSKTADDHGPANHDMDVDALLDSKAEDIPQVFAKRMQKEEKKKSGFLGFLFFLLFVLVLVAAVLWFGRAQVVNRFPEAAKLYQMVGVQYEEIGEGLEFRGVTSEMTKRSGKQVLIVRGVIANTVPRERAIPLLRLVLLDSNGAVIQEAYAKARRDMLEKGAQVGFQIAMEDPSGAAARYEVTFAEPPAESAEPQAMAPQDGKAKAQ